MHFYPLKSLEIYSSRVQNHAFICGETQRKMLNTHCDINFLLGSNFIYFKPHSVCIFGIPFAMNFILVQIM